MWNVTLDEFTRDIIEHINKGARLLVVADKSGYIQKFIIGKYCTTSNFIEMVYTTWNISNNTQYLFIYSDDVL